MPMPLPGVDWNAIKALYLQGLMPHAISLRTGVKPNTIRAHARYNGWQIARQKAIDSLSVPLRGDLANELAKQHSTALAKASKHAQEAFSGEISHQVSVLQRRPARTLTDLANTKHREGRASVVQKLVNTAAKLYGWDAQSQQPATLNLTQVNLTSDHIPGAKIIDVSGE